MCQVDSFQNHIIVTYEFETTYNQKQKTKFQLDDFTKSSRYILVSLLFQP